jgi:hypothetical protein
VIKTNALVCVRIFTTILQEGIDCGQRSDKLNTEELLNACSYPVKGANAICYSLGSGKIDANHPKTFQN